MSPLVRSIVSAALLLLGLILLQLLFGRFLGVAGVTPDFPLVGLLFIGRRLGRMHVTVLGFAAGLLMDLATGEVIGILAFAKTLTGFGTGFLHEEEHGEPFHLSRFVLISAALVLFHNLAAILLYFRTVGTDVLSTIAKHGLGGTAYTMMFLTIVVLIVSRARPRVDLQRSADG